MSAAPASRALDVVVPVLVAATVVAFAAGSSSVAGVKQVGLDARWAVLLALALAASAWAKEAGWPPPVPLFAAAAFVTLALVSALWSVAPGLSANRAASVALLFAAAAAVAAGARRSSALADRVLLGLLSGAATVALLGAVVLAASYGTAVTPASIEAPPRFQGFGENPNTVPLLLAVALPLAVGWATTAKARRARWAAIGAVALFGATIVGSGSRGALLAGALGTAVALVLPLRRGRGPVLALGAVLFATIVAAMLQSLPRESGTAPTQANAPAAASTRHVDVERAYPLDNDIGRPLPGGGEPPVDRTLLGASGRAEAWGGALDRAAGRPLLGFGFGTEGRVFVDRYYGFVGGLPENSYIGAALQLGIVGLAALLGLVGALLLRGRRALALSAWGPACAGVVVAGLAVAAVQSYLYSAGNIAAASFWIAAFLLPALSEEPG